VFKYYEMDLGPSLLIISNEHHPKESGLIQETKNIVPLQI